VAGPRGAGKGRAAARSGAGGRAAAGSAQRRSARARPRAAHGGEEADVKEEKRFNRYDRNRDGTINRNEMLSTRVKAFQKLDANHDNLLSFEEWAVKTANRFKEIDRNGDGIISRDELNAYYAAQDAKKADRDARKAAECACAKPGAKSARPPKGKPGADDEEDDN
jgi:hypothetical protein